MKKVLIISLLLLLLSLLVFLAWNFLLKQPAETTGVQNQFLDYYNDETAVNADSASFYTWDELSWEGPEFTDAQIQGAFSRYYEPQKNYYDFVEGIVSDLIWLQDARRPAIIHQEAYNTTPNKKDMLFLNNILCYIGRDNDRILKGYKHFKPFVFKYLTKKKYQDMNVRLYLATLEEAYIEFNKDGMLNRPLLKEFYTVLTDVNDDEYYSIHAKVKSFLSAHDVYYPEVQDDDYEMADRLAWAYSFWARRYAEGNMYAVKTVLDDLWAHYENDTEAKIPHKAVANRKPNRDDKGNMLYNIYYNGWLYAKYQYDSNYKRTGNWIIYSSDGEISEEFEMKDGLMDGRMKEYCYANATQLTGLYTFSKDTLLSEERYACNGDLKRKRQFRNGELNGDFYEDKNNRIISATYVNGVMDGSYVEKYSENGNLWREGVYENGVLKGEYKTYFPDGTLESNSFYKDGSLKKVKLYNKNGKMISDMNIEEGGYFRKYYPDGTLKEDAPYVDGKIHGKVIEYDESGKVIKRTKYENGVKKK